MRPREQIKRAHESAVIDQFVSWLNRSKGARFTVVDRPDPPDAIIVDGNKASWVEHADLYRDWEEAREELTFVTPGERHICHSENPIADPDLRTAAAFVQTMRDKLTKGSYKPIFEKYGRGYLVISERDPLFDRDTIQEIDCATEAALFREDKRYFKGVFLALRGNSGLVFGKVRYYRTKLSRLLWRALRYLTSAFSRRENPRG